MKIDSLQETWRRRSLVSTVVVLAVTSCLLVPIIAGIIKNRNETEVLSRVKAFSLAYRERILSNDIQFAENSAQSLLQPSEHFKVLTPDFSPIFDRLDERERTDQIACRDPICWDFLHEQIIATAPIYFTEGGRTIFGYGQLRANIAIDWAYIGILFAAIALVLLLQNFFTSMRSNTTSKSLSQQVEAWTQQLAIDPKSIERQPPPFAELAPLSDALGILGDQIKEFEKKSELMTLKSLSHDLMTPLQQVSTYLYILEQDLRCGKPLDLAKVHPLQSSIDRLKSLAAQMCRLGERSRVPLEKVDLNAIVSDIRERYLLASPDREIAASIPVNTMLSANKDHLFRIFENLISNSLEAGASRVELAFKPDGQQFKLRVSDNGSGIDPSQQIDIFEPGVTSKRGSNFGLGLATVRKLCEEIGMRIAHVDSDAGAAFELGGRL